MLPLIPKSLFAIPARQVSFQARGFESSDPEVCQKLEGMIGAFAAGHNLALRVSDPEQLVAELHRRFDDHHVGFAYEGVGFCLALTDAVSPMKSNQLMRMIKGIGKEHDYIMVVGAGLALARVPWGRQIFNRYLEKLDPLLGWCVPCGYGFHEGFFHHHRYIDRAEQAPAWLSRLSKDLFDNGVGRSLWWVKCANPEKIASAIQRFGEHRRAEIWAGIGIAAAYAGGIGPEGLLKLYELSGPFQRDLLSGLPFAARLRQKANNPSQATDMACRVLLEMSGEETAHYAKGIADALENDVTGTGVSDAYALLRRRLVTEMERFAGART